MILAAKSKKHQLSGLAGFRASFSEGKARGPNRYVLLLGLKTFETPELIKAVERGLSYNVISNLSRNVNLSLNRLAAIIQIPERTLARRKEQGRLQADESDRTVRLARIIGKAIELFEGDHHAALRWLSEPQPALGGQVPLEHSKTELGAAEVENLIGRLEHGVFT
jgi:putative toxin-antitoxin system antitoxin component (TIGR02293 family)